MRKLPSTWSIVWTDSACWQITSIAAVVFVVALLIKLTGTLPGGRGKPDIPVDPEFASLILAYAVAGILFLLAIVALRVARIRSLFDRGLKIEATVRKVKRVRGGTTLKLELQHAGPLGARWSSTAGSLVKSQSGGDTRILVRRSSARETC